MKCHYTYDEVVGKVLIPGWWSVVHSGSMEDCTCYRGPTTPAGFERERYNQTVAILKNEIKELERYNAQLQREIKKLLKIHARTDRQQPHAIR